METVLKRTLLLLSLAAVAYSATTNLRITPEKTHILILEGDMLKLDCIQIHTKDADDKAVYKKDGQDITGTDPNGYHIQRTNSTVQMTMAVTSNDTYKSTLTLTKNVTTSSDQGVFECYLADRSSTINVYILQLQKQDAELPETGKMEQAELQCQLKGVPESLDKKTFEWKHKDTVLKNDDKFTMFNNGTLIVSKPTREDMGEYFCTVTFFPNSTVERHTFTPRAVYLNAGPEIVHHDNTKNMVEGDKLELKCDVTGYPVPTVTWLKDKAPINESNRIHFVQYKLSATGMLQIFELTYADEGNYACVAANSVPPFNATANMTLRVKDKLAALWPFLGIVAEVVILCVIILVYERRRSKKLADEDDSADGNVDNTVDHKDVRHRRT